MPFLTLARYFTVLVFVCSLSNKSLKQVEKTNPDRGVLLGAIASRADNIRADYLHAPENGGLKGEGVVIAVGDWLSAHIDLKDRYLNEPTGEDYSHGSLVGGMIAGEGILRPTFKGVAPKSKLISAPGRISNGYISSMVYSEGVVITAKPSGGPFNCLNEPDYPYGGYTIQSKEYDEDMRRHPELIHVTSAGNQGNTQCSTDAYRTIAAGAQAAKNTLTVGAVGIDNLPYGNTSRGPTADGRLKPEIVAIGTGFFSTDANQGYNGGAGTSFSAPQVSGGLALLYEHYRNQNNGENPDAALMKALVCNTAEDLGNPGPDFHYGYGKINLRRAKELMDEPDYYAVHTFNNSGDSLTRNINVPEGVQELRIMLYWNDESADDKAPYGTRTLLNDIDLKIEAPDGSIFLPYILDGNNPEAIATNGEDHLNNMEQVLIPNPASGIYTIHTQAFDLGGTEPQKAYIVYEMLRPELKITSPLANETLPGATANYYIEWDYYGNSNEDFHLSYSTDLGASWMTIDTVANDKRIYKWSKYNMAGLNQPFVLLSITTADGLYADTLTSPFKIYDGLHHTDIQLEQICDDPTNSQMRISWLDVCPDCLYEISFYDKFTNQMLPMVVTSDNEYVLTYNYTYGEMWFALTVQYPDGRQSLRSNAVRFIPDYINIKVLLEGALDSLTETMHTQLNERNFLPRQINTLLVEDEIVYNGAWGYTRPPFDYTGTEVNYWTSAKYTSNMVDWVLLSLRYDTTPETEFAKTTAMLLSNGDIRIFEYDFIDEQPTGAFYIVIEHRNHFPAMSPIPVAYDPCTGIEWDFTTQDSWSTTTTVGQKAISPNLFAMIAGNMSQENDTGFDVNGDDKTFWFLNNGRSAYHPTDFNLDGDINGADKILWFKNNGMISGVITW